MKRGGGGGGGGGGGDGGGLGLYLFCSLFSFSCGSTDNMALDIYGAYTSMRTLEYTAVLCFPSSVLAACLRSKKPLAKPSRPQFTGYSTRSSPNVCWTKSRPTKTCHVTRQNRHETVHLYCFTPVDGIYTGHLA